MKRLVILFAFFFALSTLLFAQDKPATADAVLKSAMKTATAESKQILLIFHASWCKWCKRLDAALSSTELQPVISKYFVVTHLDVHERAEKVELLENPGGRDKMKSLGAATTGLPFYAILDKKGKKLVNSNVLKDNENLGYPGTDEEITAFIGMLKKANKKISSADLTTIQDYLMKHKP